MARYKICPIGNAVLLRKDKYEKLKLQKNVAYENGDKQLLINLIKHIRIKQHYLLNNYFNSSYITNGTFGAIYITVGQIYNMDCIFTGQKYCSS